MVPPTVGWRRESQRVERNEGAVNVSRNRHVFSSLQSYPALHDCRALKSSQALLGFDFARQNFASAKTILSDLDKNVGLKANRIASSLHTLLCCFHSVIHLHTHLIKRKEDKVDTHSTLYQHNENNTTKTQAHETNTPHSIDWGCISE